VVVDDEYADDTNGAGAGDGDAPQNPGPSTPPTSPTIGVDINTQLAEVRKLEAKLVEEYQQVRLLRATIVGEASARGERARELGKQVRERINADLLAVRVARVASGDDAPTDGATTPMGEHAALDRSSPTGCATLR
jgi:hypothetical protein